MATVTPKEYTNALVALIRADTTLGDYPVRVGPQPSFNLGKQTDAVICVYLMGMDAEEPFSGNNARNIYTHGILIAIKDDDDSDDVEDLRYELLEAMQNLLTKNRSLACAKRTNINSIELGIVDLDSKDVQRFRYAEITLQWETMRSQQPTD